MWVPMEDLTLLAPLVTVLVAALCMVPCRLRLRIG